MVYIDANYFIRLILKDIPEQYDQAYKLINSGAKDEIQLLTSTIAFFEVYWVLSSYYQIPKARLAAALNVILKMNFINLPERTILSKAVVEFEQTNFGLEDCYHLCYAKELRIDSFATFDKKLSRKFKNLKKQSKNERRHV